MNDWHLRRAVAVLRCGGIVVHATEGVWGLACDPFDPAAVQRLLALKQRSVAKGLIVVGSDSATFAPELDALDPADRARVAASWPGAVTWILPNQRFPRWITGAHRRVALRVPAHPQARALCAVWGGPLVSTSANSAGRRPARNVFQARVWVRNVRRRVPGACQPGCGIYLLPGEVLGHPGPSEIRTLRGERLRRRETDAEETP
ncbi:MAG: L-threonylcarbamoyladenylate synthase [Pseudomonadota bacterium]